MEQQYFKSQFINERHEPEAKQIFKLMNDFTNAVRARDLRAILSAYTDDAVVYDVRDSLQIDKEGIRKSWQECFDSSRDFNLEFQDPKIKIEGDIAFAYHLSRSTGMTNDGQKIDIWLRVTHGFVKRNGRWLVAHEHVSVPGDFISGKLLQDLKPSQLH